MRTKVNCNNHHVKSKSGGGILSILSIFLLGVLFFLSDAAGDTVNKHKAEKVVIGWLKTDSRPLGAALGRTITNTVGFNDEDGNVLYYCFYLEPDGFIITPADDLVEPIICFAERGAFDASEDNFLAALVSRDLPGRIEQARQIKAAISRADNGVSDIKSKISKAKKAKKKWDNLTSYSDEMGILGVSGISDVRVEPFVLSTWGQANIGGYPDTPACYNYYTPPYGPDDNRNYPCGCVATAMSQLIRYHEHPASYTWSNMPLEPDLSMTDTERQAIGDLCFDVAQAIDTTYGPTGSQASLSKGSEKLRQSFSYSNSIYGSNPTLPSGLNGMINPNLDAGGPVLLGLSRTGGGHAVVCDGYGYNSATLYHHLNLGWDGSDNAWYNLPTVDTSSYYYNVVDECVYNIFITGAGEIISGRVTDSGGNPIPGVTIKATAAGAGPYQAVTNSRGIYALANVASSKYYTLTASKPPYIFMNKNASTGTSLDYSSSSGNVWAVDFSSQGESPPVGYNQNIETLSGKVEIITLQAGDDGLPDPPGLLRYIITQLPTHGRITDPAAGVISAVPYTILSNGNVVEYQSCNYFAGPDNFKFLANDYGTAPTGGDSEPATVSIDVDNVVSTTFEIDDNIIAEWPLLTQHHDARTQLIYYSSELDGPMVITDLAIDIHTAPGQTMNNFTIRLKHTTRSHFLFQPYFETSGWTVVYQNNEQPTPIGWRYFHLQTPFEYNGTNNLMIDFSFNNSYGTTDGYCLVSNVFANRVLLSFANSTHGNPLNWSDSTAPWPNVYGANAVPNLKLTGTIPSEPLKGDFEPDCDVDFVDVAILAEAWRSQFGEPGFNEDCDISPDNIINEKDLEQLIINWMASTYQ